VPWLGHTCQVCSYCREGRENLCDAPLFTGYTRDGGYATHVVADARFCFPLTSASDDAETAPLLCAGLIGWRTFRMAGEGRALGLYGFGAAAHILAQVAAWQGRRVYAFTRAGDVAAQSLAKSLGAAGAARCRHYLCPGRRAGAACAQGGEEGRSRGLRRHSHVRHSELSVS
jgi:alcohol dehydrogenase, propanol-preferring